MLTLIAIIITMGVFLKLFVLSFIGGVLAGAGWIIGVVVFVITGICWLFGQFDYWYQPIIGIVISITCAFVPGIITDVGGTSILKLKGILKG